MQNLEPLSWITVQRKVSDLVPSDINPREIDEDGREAMKESLEKFNLVDIPVIDFDETIISGHQRIIALFVLERQDEIIDCRFPNRKLTEEEFKEYMLLANNHFGKFDIKKVKVHFDGIDFSRLGMPEIELGNIDDAPALSEEPMKIKTDNEVMKEIKEMEIKPYERTHILLSFPPEKIILLKPFLEEILKFEDFIEYEQSSN